jgi:hypothetical protein
MGMLEGLDFGLGVLDTFRKQHWSDKLWDKAEEGRADLQALADKANTDDTTKFATDTYGALDDTIQRGGNAIASNLGGFLEAFFGQQPQFANMGNPGQPNINLPGGGTTQLGGPDKSVYRPNHGAQPEGGQAPQWAAGGLGIDPSQGGAVGFAQQAGADYRQQLAQQAGGREASEQADIQAYRNEVEKQYRGELQKADTNFQDLRNNIFENTKMALSGADAFKADGLAVVQESVELATQHVGEMVAGENAAAVSYVDNKAGDLAQQFLQSRGIDPTDPNAPPEVKAEYQNQLARVKNESLRDARGRTAQLQNEADLNKATINLKKTDVLRDSEVMKQQRFAQEESALQGAVDGVNAARKGLMDTWTNAAATGVQMANQSKQFYSQLYSDAEGKIFDSMLDGYAMNVEVLGKVTDAINGNVAEMTNSRLQNQLTLSTMIRDFWSTEQDMVAQAAFSKINSEYDFVSFRGITSETLNRQAYESANQPQGGGFSFSTPFGGFGIS